MRRVTLYRIAISRSLSRVILGSGHMLCAEAAWRMHWSRHLLDAMFLDRGHCIAAADWEARLGREPGLVDEWRRWGWL
jgi:hypothetical protein